jgi:hypothetical protein
LLFGAAAQVHDQLGQRERALGHADEMHRLLRRHRQHQRLRVGQTDVFRREAHQPPRDVQRSSPASSMRASQ